MPKNIGIENGRLHPCPSSPNCVLSYPDTDPSHRVESLRFTGSPEEAQRKLKAMILSMPRTRLVSESPHYAHFEFTSRLLRFVDDLEFLIDPASSQIHLRSASRLGHSDLGVNRKRIDTLTTLWKDPKPTP